MANQTSVARWLYQNKDRLGARFTKFDWPTRYYPQICDFEVTLAFSDEVVCGRGLDFDQNLALEKAACEAVERYICRKLKVSSVGLAVSGRAGSAEHAKCEALERYIFDSHVEQNISFSRVTQNEAKKLSDLESSFISDSTKKIVWTIGKLNSPAHWHGFAIMALAEGIPCCIGLGLDSNADAAIVRAFVETLPNVSRALDNAALFEKERTSLNDAWNCDVEFLMKISSLFQFKDPVGPISMPTLNTEVLALANFPELADAPIEPVRCVVGEGHT